MHHPQTVQSLPELWGEPSVRRSLIRKQCIASCSWPIQQVQECCPRRLLLVRYIRMPGDRIGSLLEEVACSGVVGSAMHKMDFGVTLRSA